MRGWFTAEGLPEEVSERWPWNRASRPTSLAENIDGIPEDDDLNFTMLGVALLERCGTGFDALDVAKIWLDYMPPGRIFTAERVAVRNLLEAYLPPETATRRNPVPRVDRRPAARRRLRLGRARRPGRGRADGVGGRARQPHGERRLRGDVHGRGARGLGRRVVAGGVRRRRPLGRAGREQARRGAADGARARRSSRWEETVDELYARYDDYHWVHAINNTALVAAALYAFDDDFSGAISAVVQGGWDTDTNGAAVGSIVGAAVGVGGIEERWSAPLGGRFTSSLPGFDGITLDELVQRTIAVAGAPAAA